jgi:CHASE2 domain-containing sensor protein
LSVTRNIYDAAELPQYCVHQGYIELPRDIRRVPATLHVASNIDVDSLSLAAVKAADSAAYEAGAAEGDRDFPYSEFLPLSSFISSGEGQTLFTGHEINTADRSALTAKLLNRIVLIGADWHTLAFGQGSYADRHPTPAGDLPGVVLHANYVEAALQRGTNKAFPESLSIVLEGILVLSLSILGMLEIHWAWKWSAVLLSCIAVIVFGYLLLRTFGLMLDFFFPLIFLGLHSGYEHVREWRHGAEKE